METYKMTIAGLERVLPICEVNEHLDIAGFVIFGDVEITVASAKALLEKCPEFDYIVTPEAKSIPLAYEMAKQSGKPYFVCRKGAIASGAHAGNLARAVAQKAGGSGGGKPDMAMAGAKDLDALPGALKAAAELLKEMLH